MIAAVDRRAAAMFCGLAVRGLLLTAQRAITASMVRHFVRVELAFCSSISLP